MRYVGRSFIFDYPTEFVTLPEYTKRRGQRVRVLRRLRADEADTTPRNRMYEVQARDGWTGHAWADELKAGRP